MNIDWTLVAVIAIVGVWIWLSVLLAVIDFVKRKLGFGPLFKD